MDAATVYLAYTIVLLIIASWIVSRKFKELHEFNKEKEERAKNFAERFIEDI